MELREYWGILARRWQWVALITGLTLVASALMLGLGPRNYKGELRITISVKPEARQSEFNLYDPRYYSWLTSEYLVDDFGEVIKSDSFAQDVAQRLQEPVPVESIKRDLSTKKTHRILTVAVTTPSFKQTSDIAGAIRDTMEAKAQDYFLQLDSRDATMRVIDGPKIEPEMGLGRRLLEVVLRTTVGFLAGVALVFLLHYLDPSVRTAAEAERLLGLPVLAELPR